MKILHVVTGLNVGGAEMQLRGLCQSLQALGFEQKVVSLLPEGPLTPSIRAFGVECIHLNLRQDRPDFSKVGLLRREIVRFGPAVIHSWMYHACIYGSLAASFMRPGIPQLWSIHYSSIGFKGNSFSTLSALTACRFLSFQKQVHIAYCAEAAKRAHEDSGYCKERGMFLPNGYDGTRYFRRSETRDQIRAQFNIPADATVFGLVARFDVIKDHTTFLQAAALAIRNHPKLIFVLIGDGIDQSNAPLVNLIQKNNLTGSVVLAGRRPDMPTVYTALDFVVLSSRGEAFPNVLCEGMLCEVPCISTDVGDCRAIIGETGFVAPPGSPETLGQAFEDAANLTYDKRRGLGEAARLRITTKFSLEQYSSAHVSLYGQLSRHGQLSKDAG
jgi:glycosyltransferase involved in cell wall biosynthesis